MIIRDANAGDIPALRLLELQSDTAAHWPLSGYEAIFHTDAPRRLARVLEDNGQTSGFLVASCLPWQWEIENLVVTGEMRRRGLGSRLAGDLIGRGRSAGVERICLEVRESNRSARSFYLKLGFLVSGRRSDYYSDPTEDAVLYQFDLTKVPLSSGDPPMTGVMQGLKHG